MNIYLCRKVNISLCCMWQIKNQNFHGFGVKIVRIKYYELIMNYHECGDLCWMKRETKSMKGKDPFHQMYSSSSWFSLFLDYQFRQRASGWSSCYEAPLLQFNFDLRGKKETGGVVDIEEDFRVLLFRLRKDVRKGRRSRNPPFLNTTFSLLKPIFYAFPLN